MSGGMCYLHPTKWHSWLSLAEYWYNTSYHTSIKMSPYQALYGISPQLPTLPPITPSVAAVEELLRERAKMNATLQERLTVAQNRMKQQAYAKRSERKFNTGDWVYLRIQPYRQSTLAKRCSHKLTARYYGPYCITKKIGKVAYKLQLPPECKIIQFFMCHSSRNSLVLLHLLQLHCCPFSTTHWKFNLSR